MKKKTKPTKKLYNCSYAYDVPCYKDFVVAADTEEEAEAIIEAALKAGKFDDVMGNLCWENAPENERVFVSGAGEAGDLTMEELIAKTETIDAKGN